MRCRYSSKVKRSNGNAQFAVQFCVAAPFEIYSPQGGFFLALIVY